MSDLRRHAILEKNLSVHLRGRKQCTGEVEGMRCPVRTSRNEAYEAYTKTPHPSTLGRGGTR